MAGVAEVDTRAVRRDVTRERILEAAWELARDQGLAAVSLREVAARVGMRAPSLYTYFPSKNAIYDAMYASSPGRWPAGAREPIPRPPSGTGSAALPGSAWPTRCGTS